MSQKKKDPMMRLVYDHENISEFVENYEQIMYLKYSKSAWNDPKAITEFFKHTLTEHIAFEERVIFPAVLENAPNQSIVKPLIAELLEEHNQMRTMLINVLDQLVNTTFPLDEKEMRKVMNYSGQLLEKMQKHAAKEDDKLVPVIRRMPHIFEIKEEGQS